VSADSEILAAVRTADDEVHPVAVRQGSALVTSFHPEVTDDLAVHEYFLGMVEERRSGATAAAQTVP